MLQGLRFSASCSQPGLPTPVIRPRGSWGPLSLASIYVSESFPQLLFFLRVLVLLKEKSILHNDLCLPLQIIS